MSGNYLILVPARPRGPGQLQREEDTKRRVAPPGSAKTSA